MKFDQYVSLTPTNFFLIGPLLRGFQWFDEGLQNYFRATGKPQLSRPQSMIMIHVIRGTTRPSDIARELGISRQAIHSTLAEMVEMDMLEMSDDPEDRRNKIVKLSAIGQRRRQRAEEAIEILTEELTRRIGKRNVDNLFAAFGQSWGQPVSEFKLAANDRSRRRRLPKGP